MGHLQLWIPWRTSPRPKLVTIRSLIQLFFLCCLWLFILFGFISVFSGNLVWSLKFADTSKAGSESRGCEEESIEEESK